MQILALKTYSQDISKTITSLHHTLSLQLLSSADNLCKQFGPTSGLTDILIVLLKEIFEKLFLKKKSADDKSMENYQHRVKLSVKQF